MYHDDVAVETTLVTALTLLEVSINGQVESSVLFCGKYQNANGTAEMEATMVTNPAPTIINRSINKCLTHAVNGYGLHVLIQG